MCYCVSSPGFYAYAFDKQHFLYSAFHTYYCRCCWAVDFILLYFMHIFRCVVVVVVDAIWYYCCCCWCSSQAIFALSRFIASPLVPIPFEHNAHHLYKSVSKIVIGIHVRMDLCICVVCVCVCTRQSITIRSRAVIAYFISIWVFVANACYWCCCWL